MFQVKTLREEDFVFAIQLTDCMNWNMTTNDFALSVKLEPEGCFVLNDGNKRVGLVTSISYGSVGWFGNLVVEQSQRRKGAGKKLVEQTVGYLKNKGAKTIGLFAYEHLIDFYRGFGFREDNKYVVLCHDKLNLESKPWICEIEDRDLTEITRLDKECFGADRKKLYRTIFSNINNLSYGIRRKSGITGFITAKVNQNIAEVGPLVFRSNHDKEANQLLKKVLSKLNGLQVFLYLPQKQSALNQMLTDLGFKETFKVSRMFLGDCPNLTEFIYLPESLERG
jgi:GNAT superfamily N-acetyltransferase